MDAAEDTVITLLHHNTETLQHVSGYEGASSYTRTIQFFVSDDYIQELKTASVRCEQFMLAKCTYSQGFYHSYLVDFNGQQYEYEDDNRTCKCRLDKACVVDGTSG